MDRDHCGLAAVQLGTGDRNWDEVPAAGPTLRHHHRDGGGVNRHGKANRNRIDMRQASRPEKSSRSKGGTRDFPGCQDFDSSRSPPDLEDFCDRWDFVVGAGCAGHLLRAGAGRLAAAAACGDFRNDGLTGDVTVEAIDAPQNVT
ncbi:hypothetical protein V7x_36120 [Crateriforma conspicua]|uniref:Uncharacterized protein n=1 Tax=Crateriforma conspicua TaxID=2527996 RepID=A0A5C6FLA4_9PLAN|nr:hypothetical protein V7x_36120 [Crateriforma conspicua]